MQATSNDNTLIGYRAGNNLSTGVRNTLIGSIPLIKSSIVTT